MNFRVLLRVLGEFYKIEKGSINSGKFVARFFRVEEDVEKISELCEL